MLNAMDWIGVDVGGPKKRFDVAVIDEASLRDLRGRLTCNEVVGIVEKVQPNGLRSTALLVRARRSEITRVRTQAQQADMPYPLDARRDSSGRERLLRLDHRGPQALRGARLIGRERNRGLSDRVLDTMARSRGSQRRSAWTREGLTKLGLNGVPNRTNQDQRDAIAAALTARQHAEGLTECFGEIVVPVDGL